MPERGVDSLKLLKSVDKYTKSAVVCKDEKLYQQVAVGWSIKSYSHLEQGITESCSANSSWETLGRCNEEQAPQHWILAQKSILALS